jgi:hypothetical protein
MNLGKAKDLDLKERMINSSQLKWKVEKAMLKQHKRLQLRLNCSVKQSDKTLFDSCVTPNKPIK